MPLDEATRRFAFLLQRDLRRLAESRSEREGRGEALKFDSVTRFVTYETKRGDITQRLTGEILATYSAEDRILRWAWAGRAPSAPVTHGDVVFREGQARGVPQLSMSVVGDLDFEEASILVTLGALVARAEGMHDRKVSGEVQFVGLFDRPRPPDGSVERALESRFSVPPPPAAPDKPREGSVPPPRAYRSLPPITEIYEPRTGGSRPPPATSATRSPSVPPPPAVPKIEPGGSSPPASANVKAAAKRALKEPAREIFLPVASAALLALTEKSAGYLQGLFAITIDPVSPNGDPRRIFVQLVVIDRAGILRALDPPAALVEAAATMVDADRRAGNGAWRKLSARVTPKADGGATLNVDVT